jgi:Flp pilus assembly pilin Flp
MSVLKRRKALGGGFMDRLKVIQRVLLNESGQGLTEYGLILVVISIVSVTVLTTLGQDLNTLMQQVIPLGAS